MAHHVQAKDTFTTERPNRVSDRRLARLDLTALAVSTIMALGPLTAYAIVGG